MDCVDCLSNDKFCCCPFFSKHEQEQQSGKTFENVLIMKQNNLEENSVAHIKLTLYFQIQVQGIEENIESHLASLALMKTL